MFVLIALNAYLKELDSRVAEAQLSLPRKKHVPPRKNRVAGSELKSVPPTGYPKWAVSKDWLKGVLYSLKLLIISMSYFIFCSSP